MTIVPLGTGPPTRAEMLAYYPGKFSWTEMKTFVNSGDLGLLKRDKALQKRYDEWNVGLRKRYGSIVNFLVNYRLQWGKPDALSLLPSALSTLPPLTSPPVLPDSIEPVALPPLPADAPPYFTASTPPDYISIIQNDWPYSVPNDVEHTLIWTRLPIFHSDLIDDKIASRIDQDGIWGFTGLGDENPPSPSTLPACLPSLAEWGVTLDKMIVSARGTPDEEALVLRAGEEVMKFVRNRWIESEWETAWFVNPPRLQSVPGLAHIHVFACKK
ncbi:hypothetical protein CYLTODRAFT_346384 [Cylindrobasidium torrendii FP15055 ss-10]|uniref:Uncharacterized protein n=1 Tax=Cylindrobasidium torrendii FP15055 ss-10 TaxID=1314674 RepID=A0A0D7BM71_9AGAR|nr:hypothetical protein CYLTODRAFT_346384 [Cylindrobasidium torrendii FP15055 ss-10]